MFVLFLEGDMQFLIMVHFKFWDSFAVLKIIDVDIWESFLFLSCKINFVQVTGYSI